jgi:hypothetical protein
VADVVSEQGHGSAHGEAARFKQAELIQQGLAAQEARAPQRRFPRGTNWFFRLTRALVGYP